MKTNTSPQMGADCGMPSSEFRSPHSELLRVLILEDVPTDAELVERELRTGGITFTSMRVDTEEDFLREIERFSPHIVLSDYSLPSFNGMKALELTRERCPDLPFIIVTAAVNEETAVRCVKAGADDYITKDHLARLGPAVRSALLRKNAAVEKERLNQAMRDAAREWRVSFDAMSEAVCLMDLRGRIRRCNKAMSTLAGSSCEDMIGKLCCEVLHGSPQPLTACPLKRMRESHKRESLTIPIDARWLDIAVDPIFDEPGNLIGAVHVVSDITAHREAERLRIENRAVEAANEAKSAFLANMSHELRTPLNSVIGFSEVLLQQYFGELNGKQSEYVTDILRSGKHLLSLINDILDLSKVEAGRMELDVGPVHVRALLEGSMTMIREQTHRHGISLTLDMPDGLSDLEVIADERKVKQVLFNLLSNAAKFTPDGGKIRVSTEVVSDECAPASIGNRQSAIRISVADTGIGIAPEHHDKIFEEFYQVRGAEMPRGTGLGLPLSKRLVELHGGRLWLESKGTGKGSIFSFALPLKPIQCKAEHTAERLMAFLETLPRDRTPLHFLEKAVEFCGGTDTEFSVCAFRTVSRSPEAETGLRNLIKKKTRAGDGFLIHEEGPAYLILAGTGKDGAIAACERLREEIRNAIGCPEVTFTVAAFPNDGETAGALLRAVSPAIAPTAGNDAPYAPKTILIVEDDPSSRMFFRDVLQQHGYAILEQDNGKEGIRSATANKPDLIIMDINLPVMDGYEATRQLKAASETGDIPIVAITSAAMKGDELRILETGCDAYLSKPCSIEDLLGTVRGYLS